MKKEIYRKLLHLSSIIYPLLYSYILSKNSMLLLTGIISLILIIMEIVRKINPKIKHFLYKNLEFMAREHEKEEIAGSTYFMIGVFLCILFFPRSIAIPAMLVLIISDAAASIFGKLFGKVKMYEEKTWVGFFSFAVSASLISLFFNKLFIIPAILTALFELYSKKLKVDDNLLVPNIYSIMCCLMLL
jgi:dolichol kinase